MQSQFTSFSNGRSASFIVAGHSPHHPGNSQIAVLKTQSTIDPQLVIKPENKEYALIGSNTEIWKAEFAAYLRENASRIFSFGGVPEEIWSRVAETREGFTLTILAGGLIGLAEDVFLDRDWQPFIGGPWMATCIPSSGSIFQTSGEMYNGAKIVQGWDDPN